MLEEIEQLRQALVKRVVELTGLPISDIEVTINFHNQDNESPLAIEARGLGWYPDQHQGSAWYTSEKPSGGRLLSLWGSDDQRTACGLFGDVYRAIDWN